MAIVMYLFGLGVTIYAFMQKDKDERRFAILFGQLWIVGSICVPQ